MELIIVIFIVFGGWIGFFLLLSSYLSLKKRYKALEENFEDTLQKHILEWQLKYEDRVKKEAIEKSKAIVRGKVTEQIAPYLPGFKYNPKDVRFIGSPIDFVVFDGLDEGDLRKVVFVEVKTGKASLSNREKLIKEAIEEKRVAWEMWKLPSEMFERR